MQNQDYLTQKYLFQSLPFAGIFDFKQFVSNSFSFSAFWDYGLIQLLKMNSRQSLVLNFWLYPTVYMWLVGFNTLFTKCLCAVIQSTGKNFGRLCLHRPSSQSPSPFTVIRCQCHEVGKCFFFLLDSLQAAEDRTGKKEQSILFPGFQRSRNFRT